ADAADDLAARRLAEIQAVSEIGDERLQPWLERLRRADLVAMRAIRELDADEARDFGRPRTARVHHFVRGDDALVRAYRVDAGARDVDRFHGGEGRDVDAELAGRLREAPHERPREDDAVVGVVRSGDDAVRRELGDDLLCFAR